MVCVLNDRKQKAFLKKVAKDLYSMSKEGKSFNLKDYITSIYNRVKEKTGDEALAQTYAALVPGQIGLARQFNKDIRKLVSNIQQLEETQDLIEDINNVPEYLGVAKVEPVAPKEDPAVIAKNAFDLANPVQPTVSTFSAKPNSLFTTTGNEEDQDLAFSYSFLRNFILKNENAITSESTGYYLTMSTPEKVLDENAVSDKRNLGGYITYISDNEGNPFYFDENFKRTTKENGKLVFFNVRENESTLQTVAERTKTLGIPEEMVAKTLEFQKRLLKAKQNHILENKQQNFVVHEITFIGKGYVQEDSKAQNNLSDHATFFENATISVEPAKDGKKEKRYFERPNKTRVSFRAKPVQDVDPDFIEKSLDILMGSKNVEDIEGKKDENLIKLRQKFKDVYFGNNPRIKIADNGSVLVEGVPVTSREQLRNSLLTYENNKGVTARNSLNVYQNYAGGVPFYTVKKDKIVLEAKGKSKPDYINFLLQNSFTEMVPDASGDFINKHPYLGFRILDSEQVKVSKGKAKEPAPPVEKETKTETKTKTEEPKGFTPLTLKAPKTKTNDQLKLDKLVNQKEVSETVTPEQLAKAEEWYSSTPMSKHVPFKKMFEIVNTANPKSVATFTQAGITLFKGSDLSDLYHEAFHAFSQLFLSSKERQRLYDETRKMTGSFTDFEGNRVTFDKADDLQIEEYLAEKFRKYMLADGKMDMPAAPAAKSFFQKLLDILKALFNVDVDQSVNNYEASYYLNAVFSNLRVGNINQVPYGYENRQFDKLNKITAISPDLQAALDELPYSKQLALVNSIDSLFSQIVDELNAEEKQTSGRKFTTLLITDINKRVALYNRVLESLVEKYNEYGQEIGSLSEESDEYAELYSKIKTLEAGILNFSHNSAGNPEKGVTVDDILQAESKNAGLIAYHMQKSKYMSFEDKFNPISDPEEKNLNDRDGYSHLGGNEISAKELASNDVLYTIRGLFQYDDKGKVVLNELGFPELQKFDVSWNRIFKLLEGSKTPDEMYKRLEASQNKDIKQFIGKIGNPEIVEGQDLSLSQYNLWTHIQQAFSLKRIPLIQVSVHVKGKDNDLTGITVGNAIAETDVIKRGWDNSFMSPKTKNAYVVVTKGEGKFLNVSKVLNDFKTTYKTDPIRFLNAIGMQISDNVNISAQLASRKSKVSEFLDIIWKELNSVNSSSPKRFINKPSDLISDEQTGVYSELLRLELKYSDEYGNAMVSNAKGDAQYEMSLRSTASDMIDYLNNAESYAELIAIPEMSHLDVSRNPQIKGLRMMTELFGENYWQPGKGQKQFTEKLTRKIPNTITLLNSSGVQVIKDDDFRMLGASSNESDSRSYYLQNLYMMLKYGVAEGTRHSDKSTTYLYRMQFGGKNLYIPFDEFYGDGATARNSFKKALMGYLGGETERIYKLQNGDTSGNALVGDKTYKEAGSKIVGLEDVFGPALNKRIEKNLVSDDFMETVNLPKNTKLRQDIETAINNYIDKRTETFKNTLDKAGVFNNKKLMDEVVKNVPVTDYAKAKDMAAMAFVMNDFMHKFETTTLLYGDVVLYNHLKEEFHKRNAGFAATGTIPRTDNHMLQLLNSKFKGKYSETASFKASGFTMKDPSRTWGRTMNSAVLEDTKLESVYANDYIEIAKKAEARRLKRELTPEENTQIEKSYKEYKDMKSGDGQGWISFDSYRALLLSLGKWSQYQEDMYNAIIRGEDVSAKDVAQFFPIKKMQYWGPLKTDGLNVVGFHKFSLMPLIPTIVKNSNLEILHNKMTAEGIDYALFQSGSKINTMTKDGKVDKFYNDPTLKEGTGVAFADPAYTFTVNEIYLNYFKDQLEIADTYKNSVIFSTQLRKLVEEGLMEEGKPIDYSGTKEEWDALDFKEKIKYPYYAKIINYEKLVRQLTEFKTEELIKEADITFDGNTFKVTDKLINFLKKELTRQDLADHEIDFLKYDNSDQLVYDLSIHPSAGQLEKLVSALIYKRIVRQKVTGEALIQVSGVGFEPSSLRKATEEESKRFGTLGLPFYQQNITNFDDKYKGYNKTGLKDAYNTLKLKVKDATYWSDRYRDALSTELAYLDAKIKGVKPEFTEIVNPTSAMKIKIALQGDFKKLLKHPDVLTEAKAKGINALDALNSLIQNEEWLNKDDNRKMVTITGVRIPVQGLNSMEFAEVFEFLPENSGNMIILPAEMVAKSGSDFDIDKLSLLFPSILKTSKGVSLVKHDKSLANKLDKDAIKQEIKQLYVDLDKANESFLKFAKDYLANLPEESVTDFYDNVRFYKEEILTVKNNIWNEYEMGDVYPEQFYDQLYDLNEKLNDLFETAAKPIKDKKQELTSGILEKIDQLKTDLAKSSSKGIENDLLFAIVDIVSVPQNFVDLTTPNGTFLIKDLAENLSKDVREYDPFATYNNKGNVYEEGDKKRISATRIFETEYNEYKQGSNNIGKRTLGLGAVDNTYNTIFNRIGAYMSAEASLGSEKNPYTAPQVIRGMVHNTMNIKGEQVISLSQLYDANKKNRISTIISQMMNGWVDVAKDSWIFDIQGNPEISPVLLFMIQAGVPLEQAIYFVSQPIIRDYVKIQREVRGTFAIPMKVPSAGTNLYRIEAKKQLLSGLLKEEDQYILDVYDQKRTIYKVLVPRYLEKMPVDFSVDTLKKSVKKTGKYTTADYQAFIHFIELEEMSKATTAVKLGMNFDTSKLTSTYEIREKLEGIGEILKEKRMPFEVIDDIEDASPIGGFKTNRKLLDMISGLFPTRDNEDLVRDIKTFTASMTDDDIRLKYGNYFDNKTDLINAIKNDFVNYIYQQYLVRLNSSFDPKEDYKSLKIEKALKLEQGAFVKDNTLVVDFAVLNSDYAKKTFSKPEYLSERRLATVPESYFSLGNLGKKEFAKFVYERELLRSIVTFDKYSKSEDFKYRVDRLKLMSATLPKEVPVEVIAYEEFLRDNALLNIKNIPFMFKDSNGFAKQIIETVGKYPELAKKYPVLNSFFINTRQGVTNLKLSELIMDSDTANEYHENISDLSDPTVEKVSDYVDNAYISKLFSILPVFAFIQSGQGARGQINLGKVMPTTNLSNILSTAVNYTLNNILNDSALSSKYLGTYLNYFDQMYAKPSENVLPEDVSTIKPIFKNYYKDSTTEEEKKEKKKETKKKFLTTAEYNSDVLLYDSTVSLEEFRSKIKEYLGPKTGSEPSISVKKFTYARTNSNSYEVSTAGDSRFSALNAKLKDGRTIEEAYQLDIKGYRTYKPGEKVDASNAGTFTTEDENGKEVILDPKKAVIVKQDKTNPHIVDIKIGEDEFGVAKHELIPINPLDKNWKKGKGKKPLHGYSEEDNFVMYKSLWEQWAKENPKLIEDLRQKAQGKVLTDKFASTPVSQARALADILNETASNTESTAAKPVTEEVQSYGSVIVMSNSSDKYDTYNASFNGNRYNSTVIKDMFVNKEILADAIRAVITKKKSFTSKTMPGDFLTDATYDSNVQNIDKLINKLIEDRDVHKRRIYFDSKGIGNTLLGYAGDEKLTEENLVAGNAPAPKTFVYLSKRLYEEFGYINPGLFEMNALIEEGNILKAQVLEKQTVTDEMVREKLRECFKSLLES